MGGERGDGIGFGRLILFRCYAASHRKASNKAHRVKGLHGKIGEIPVNSMLASKHVSEFFYDNALE
jgi:hypothetical protein